MSWFSSRRGAAARPTKGGAVNASSPAASSPPAPPGLAGSAGHAAHSANAGNAAKAGKIESHRSLALASLVESFAGRQRSHVLDLGPAVGGNVEFIADHGCKVYIQDLYPVLLPGGAAAAGLLAGGGSPAGSKSGSAAARAMATPTERAVVREARNTWEARQEREDRRDELAPTASRRGQMAQLLEFPADTRFDAVLAWDLLNYLERDEVAALARQLVQYCRPGAMFFALISILKEIPDEPLRFRILDRETLAYEPHTDALRPCPRYAPAELNELLRGFRLDRSFLMRHGMQEYLFSRREE